MTRARGEAVLRDTRLLRDLFATDVQDYAPRIAELRAGLAQIDAGGPPPPPFGGNVYRLTLGAGHATIVNTLDRSVPPETVPIDDFAAAFRVWAETRRAG